MFSTGMPNRPSRPVLESSTALNGTDAPNRLVVSALLFVTVRASQFVTQLEKRNLLLINKPLKIGVVVEQERNNLSGRTVADSDPDDLWRSAAQDTQPVKVLILGHEHATMVDRQLPDVLV